MRERRRGVILTGSLLAGLLALHPAGTFGQAKATKPPARPPAASAIRVEPADVACPALLGYGVKTQRQFCDVVTGSNPSAGILVTIPPHQGTATLLFDLHNRHTYSAELVQKKQAYRHYTATIGVLLPDMTLVDRAVIDSEFRSEKDLFDRIAGGAGPGGVKAVAPTGAEFVQLTLPATATELSILGEKLTEVRPDGTSVFTSPGRPVASISNVMIEYRPGPAPRPPAKKKD